MNRAARILRAIGWAALFLGALFIAAAIYLAGVYGGPSAVRDLFSASHLPDLLALLSALVPGALLIWAASRMGSGPGATPGTEDASSRPFDR